MNLQRYVSSVYCENISDTDFIKKLDETVSIIDKTETYTNLRKSYTELYTPYVNKEKDKEKEKDQDKENEKDQENEKVNENDFKTYILDTLFFDILFGKTIGRVNNNSSHTIILFPVFKDTDSTKRLLPSIRSIYKPILDKKDQKEQFKQDQDKNKNMYLFVPAFSDAEESLEEYSSDLTVYFNRAFEYILQQKQVTIGGVTQVKDTKFENICYTLDKDNKIFTSYYNKKLSTEKTKALDSIVVKFIEKLGATLTKVKDPIKSLTKEESIRKLKADGYGKSLDKINPFLKLLDLFVDLYKKTNDREYLKLTASSDSQSIFRLYYRVNDTDYSDTYNGIKPGSNFVYQLSDSLRVGYFIKKEGLTNQYIFREYTGLTAQFKKMGMKGGIELESEEKKSEELSEFAEKEEEEDSKNTQIPKEFLIQTKIFGNNIYYKMANKKGSGKFIHTIKEVLNLHIYEKYKWFKFSDIGGELSPETKIKFYKNLRFDKESVIDFLKKIDRYNDTLSVGVEFLKINQDNRLLIQYVDFLLTDKESTHVFNEDSFFSGNLESFVEKTKREIVNMLFQENKLIYRTNVHSGKEKKDIKKNYKMIRHDYYPVKDKNDLDKHFNRTITENKEKTYCKKGKCEDIIKEITNEDEYAIAIVDITKENIDKINELKQKTKCKKLRRTIRRQLNPYVKKLPQFGGILRSRRRKYRH